MPFPEGWELPVPVPRDGNGRRHGGRRQGRLPRGERWVLISADVVIYRNITLGNGVMQ